MPTLPAYPEIRHGEGIRAPACRFCESLQAMTDTAFRHWQAGRRHSGPLYLTVQSLRIRYCVIPKVHGCDCQGAQP